MFTFPFSKKRDYQAELIDTVSESLKKKQNLLISAPTGIGKTAGVLFPALCFSYDNSKKIFFLTSKTTQQQIVLDTLRLMQLEEFNCRALILKAKEKMCINNIYYCHPEFCPLIRDFHIKLKRSQVVDKLLLFKVITPDILYKIGKKENICPFELSLEMMSHANIIVGDYNYVFDPNIYLRRLFSNIPFENFILIVDEAHNLYPRGRDYYSPCLDRNKIVQLISDLKLFNDKDIINKLIGVFSEIESQFINFDKLSKEEKFLVKIDKKSFKQKSIDLQDILEDYFKYQKSQGIQLMNDPVQENYFELSRFVNILLMDDEEEFTYYYNRTNGSLEILCKDPSKMLGEKIEKFFSTIAMSATLTPLTFYQDVLGFNPEKTKTISFPSPFPKKNRKILIIPDVSTKYKERGDNYQKIANIISHTISLKDGHYFAFFPSFSFLSRVAELINLPSYSLVLQERNMSDSKRELLLNRLKTEKGNIIIFGIQGGIFAEGVDYPGDMLIGVMVVSPALPQYCFEQELIKKYYAKKYNKGFEYSYLYPGLNRVIQSVGRVIRSEKDTGIILLIDQRFKNPYYNTVFPSHWFDKSPKELISTDYKKDIKKFWKGISS